MLVVTTEMGITISHSLSLPIQLLHGNQFTVHMYGNVDTTKTFLEDTAKWLAIRFEPVGVANTVGGSTPLSSANFTGERQ